MRVKEPEEDEAQIVDGVYVVVHNVDAILIAHTA
jgi:hypothetical protein